MYSLWQDLSHGTIIFDLLTLKFDLLLKNFNHGFFLVMVAARRVSLSSDNSYLPRRQETGLYIVLALLDIDLTLANFIVPRFRESAGTLNLIRLSVSPSVCHKNFNLGHNFCTITGRALIFHMCVLCDKTFLMVPCRDLDGDLWPTSRSNLLLSWGPQFSEFACYNWHIVSVNVFGVWRCVW